MHYYILITITAHTYHSLENFGINIFTGDVIRWKLSTQNIREYGKLFYKEYNDETNKFIGCNLLNATCQNFQTSLFSSKFSLP